MFRRFRRIRVSGGRGLGIYVSGFGFIVQGLRFPDFRISGLFL